MLLIDVHVHLYDCYDLDRFLDGARGRFEEAAARLRIHGACLGVLCLMERAGQAWMERLSRQRGSPGEASLEVAGGWRASRTAETCSLWLDDPRGRRILVVGGGQMVTSEGLEVLGLAMHDRVPDGLTLDECVSAVRRADGLPVIPWGFGKWSGKRGRLLERFLLERVEPGSVFLGENGGRPAFLKEPRMFRLAGRLGIRVLAGSDPLPLPWDGVRAGGFGTALKGELDEWHPAQSLKSLLGLKDLKPALYGEPVSLWVFLRNQLMLRLRSG